MTPQEHRIQESKQNVLDAVSFKEPKKVPVGAGFYGWPFAYAGATYRDLIDDPARATREYVKCFDEIELDFTFSAGMPVPVRAFEALGNFDYAISEDGTYIMHQQALSSFMGPEVYDWVLEDPEKFYTDTFYRFKCPAFRLPREEAYAALKKAAVEFKKFQQLNGMIGEYLLKVKGVYNLPDMGSPLMYTQPFQPFFMQFRGIRDSLVDLRRMPEKVYAAVQKSWEYNMRDFHLDPKAFSDPMSPGLSGYHAEAFISPKQFDDLYFRYFEETYRPFLEAGKKFVLGSQGNAIHTLDRIRRLPKGSMIVLLDKEDPFEVYKLIGDWATIVTGITAEMLATGTKQECIDYVKKCFDTFAPGGGFLFMPNHVLLSGSDGKVENVIAAFQTANELGRK